MIGLFWMLIHALMASRTFTFTTMIVVFAIWTLYAFTDCAYNDMNSSIPLLTMASNVSQLAGPCIIPVILMYLYKLRTGRSIQSQQALFVIAPVVLFTVAMTLTYMAGPGEIDAFIAKLYTEGNSALDYYPVGHPVRIYNVFAVIVYRIVLVAELTVLVISFVRDSRRGKYSLPHLSRFVFGRDQINLLELQYYNLVLILLIAVAKIFLFRDILMRNPWISPLLALLLVLAISGFAYTALFSARKSVSRREMLHGFRYNYSQETRRAVVEEMISEFILDSGDEGIQMLRNYVIDPVEEEAARPIAADEVQMHSLAERIFAAAGHDWSPDSLMGRFQQMMSQEKAFLHPKISLTDVATYLGTNKTYISRLVNNTYHMSFPDLVNTLRIDYAEEYIVSHRGAKQADIAAACGFPSASALNNAFHKVTGLTPRIWLATYDRQHAKS